MGVDDSTGGLMMTTTKATGPVIVLETGFKMIPAKETDFLAFRNRPTQLVITHFSHETW
jgi:hypothetical protein